MKITAVETKALLVPYKKPYHSAYGVNLGAEVMLVEVRTDAGVTGYGESICSGLAAGVAAYLAKAGSFCIGRSPFENAALMAEIYRWLFVNHGVCSAPRFAGQVLAGLEMALWDLAGKATDRAVHELLGGARRQEIGYFGFAQGESAEELAAEARDLAAAGCPIIYVKVGRGEALDEEIVRQVRAAIGKCRLRVDPNEAWDPLTASRMIRRLLPYDIEFIEQPTPSGSLSALAQVRQASPVAIAADQLVFTPEDAFELCRARAADVIVLGLHETGGIGRFIKAAAVAEAAGINICIHGLYETGITTCAVNQAAATLANLDDGNQYMNHFLKEDIIKSPDLALRDGRLPVLPGPGLGFEIDPDAVARAAEAHEAHHDG